MSEPRPILAPDLFPQDQPDTVLEFNPPGESHDPQLPDSDMLASMIDASKLISYLSYYGGRMFTWDYSTDGGRPRTHYLVRTDLRGDLSLKELNAIEEHMLELGGHVEQWQKKLVERPFQSLENPGQVVMRDVVVLETVIRFNMRYS